MTDWEAFWREDRRKRLGLPPPEAKASTGPGVVALTYDMPISLISENPQRKARDAMKAFKSPWVNMAERTVSSGAAGVPWHLEDSDEEKVEEGTAWEFINNPMPEMRLTRRQVWSLTLRHMGLVGYTFWYLDQRDLVAGTPLSALYIRPDRMLPAQDKQGNLVGWVMDGDRPNGREPVGFEPDEIACFRLEPDDDGILGVGLVEAAWRKLAMSGVVDRHTEKMIASGGRMAGMIAPKQDARFSDDEYHQIVRELRNVTDSPDAAKKALIFKVPVDWQQTAATPSQMNLPDLNRMSRDDIMAIWGIPHSQVGITDKGRGLNSGETQKYEEASLWQNAREPRLTAFREVLQGDILDRWQGLGQELTLVLDTPTFDDEAPLFENAEKATKLPLTVDQRLEMVGKEPLDEKVYGKLGKAIFIDRSMVPLFLPEGATVEKQPEPEPFGGAPEPEVEVSTSVSTSDIERNVAKASTERLLGLRKQTEMTWEPRIRSTIGRYLAQQRDAVAAKVEEKAAHLTKKPTDVRVWWGSDERWNAQLREALIASEIDLASEVYGKVRKELRPGKADDATNLLSYISQRVGERISGINATTREAIRGLIAKGVEAGLSPAELGRTIREATTFDEARAELVSRTETMLAYNDAALRTYADLEVGQVQAIDGDDDAECAERNGKTFSVDDAFGITDHPNGTLDWVPVT